MLAYELTEGLLGVMYLCPWFSDRLCDSPEIGYSGMHHTIIENTEVLEQFALECAAQTEKRLRYPMYKDSAD